MAGVAIDERYLVGELVLRKHGTLPGLTGVRGVAAIGVLLFHVRPMILRLFGLDPNVWLRMIDSGFRGVDLFFILSGFILFHVHSREFETLDGRLVRRFYALRFFRVYPLNTVLLLILLPLPFYLPQFVTWYRSTYSPFESFHNNDFSFWAFVQSLLLAQSWTIVKLGTWNGPAWTLSAEVFGYAFFPLLATVVCRQKSGTHMLALASVSLLLFVVLMILGGHATNNPNGTFGLIRMSFCFIAGVCICRAFQLMTLSTRAANWCALVSTVIIILCSWEKSVGTLSVFGFGGLIFGLAYQSGPMHYIMTSLPIMYLGRISFSLYIVHDIPLNLIEWSTGDTGSISSTDAKFAILAAMFFVPLLLAMLTYKFVELPFQRLGRVVAANLGTTRPMGQAIPTGSN